MNIKVNLNRPFSRRELVSRLIQDIRLHYSLFCDEKSSLYHDLYLYDICYQTIDGFFRIGILTFREKMHLNNIVRNMFFCA